MKAVDFDNLRKGDLKTAEDLVAEFKTYCMDILGYDEFEATIASDDMSNPYDIPYIEQDYEGIFIIDDIKYEIRKCCTNFAKCGFYHLCEKTAFEFYMLFNMETIEGNTVFEYKKAEKMFIF